MRLFGPSSRSAARLFRLSDSRPPVLSRVIGAVLQTAGSPLNPMLIGTSVINRRGLRRRLSRRSRSPLPGAGGPELSSLSQEEGERSARSSADLVTSEGKESPPVPT